MARPRNLKGGNTDAGAGMIVNGTDLARTLGVSRQTVTNLTKRGMPIHDREGVRGSPRYDTARCIRWLRDEELARARGDSEDDQLPIDEITRRTELAKMRKAEIELANLEERYGDVELILDELSAALSTIRASLMALPQISPQIEHMDSAAIEKRLEEEIYRTLEELADFSVDDDDEH